MATHAYGKKAASVLSAALSQFEGNRFRYVCGFAHWNLDDLQGRAKEWRSTYAKARDDVLEFLRQAAAHQNCEVILLGPDAILCRLGAYADAMEKVRARTWERSRSVAGYVHNPTPAVIRRAMRMHADKAGFLLTKMGTIAAVAFAEKPRGLALTSTPPHSGYRTNALPMDATAVRSKPAGGAALIAKMRNTKMRNIQKVAGRNPYTVRRSAKEFAEVLNTITSFGGRVFDDGKAIFVSEKLASQILLATSIRLHKMPANVAL